MSLWTQNNFYGEHVQIAEINGQDGSLVASHDIIKAEIIATAEDGTQYRLTDYNADGLLRSLKAVGLCEWERIE